VLQCIGSPKELLSLYTRHQSERTLLLATVLVISMFSAPVAYILATCYSVDVLSSLLSSPQDCWLDWGVNIGRHCFSDYPLVASAAMRPDPWQSYPLFLPWMNGEPWVVEYPAAAMIPHLLFGLPAKWLGVPRMGLITYLLALTLAVLSPAAWATRGARGLEKLLVILALGIVAVPAWAVVDRGNSAGFAIPVALAFLVALSRRRWLVVAITVVLCAMVKPQFAVLVAVLFAARQWRLGALALVGVATSNVVAYLFWPRYFPETITRSVHNLLHNTHISQGLLSPVNVSFGRGLLFMPDNIEAYYKGGRISANFLHEPRMLIGYVILALAVSSVLLLGRRIPPVMAGIVMLATGTLFPPQINYYYLAFSLPIAALIIRNPDGPPGTGILDRLAIDGGRRRGVGLCVALAAALSIAQIPIPGAVSYIDIPGQMGARGVVGTTMVVQTTVVLAPIFWFIACIVIIFSYARRRASCGDERTAKLAHGRVARGT